MFCPNCGTQLPEGVKFCANCGSAISSATSNSNQSLSSASTTSESPKVETSTQVSPAVESSSSQYVPNTYEPIGFGDAFIYMFKHYADFKGRARRQEYWFIYLWYVLGCLIPILNYFWILATVVPMLAASVRRLQDTGRRWTYIFFTLIPIVGAILFIVWCAEDSQRGSNEYGPNPKYIE